LPGGIGVTARVFQQRLRPITDPSVTRAPRAPARRLRHHHRRFASDAGECQQSPCARDQAGVYRGELVASSGRYRLTVGSSARHHGFHRRRSTHQVANRLRTTPELAASTGGGCPRRGSPSLADAVSAAPSVQSRATVELWSSQLLVLLALFGTEWALRKYWQPSSP
jgi:hypothetical protein